MDPAELMRTQRELNGTKKNMERAQRRENVERIYWNQREQGENPAEPKETLRKTQHRENIEYFVKPRRT